MYIYSPGDKNCGTYGLSSKGLALGRTSVFVSRRLCFASSTKHYYSLQSAWANYMVLLDMETRLVTASQLQTFQPLLTCPTLLVSEAVMTAYGLSQGGALQEETGRATCCYVSCPVCISQCFPLPCATGHLSFAFWEAWWRKFPDLNTEGMKLKGENQKFGEQ